MGGVSIDGEHSQVPVESPAPTNDLGASLNGISNLGGDINGALSGIDAGTPGAGGAEISQASDLGGGRNVCRFLQLSRKENLCKNEMA